jgi:hypothetical protein
MKLYPNLVNAVFDIMAINSDENSIEMNGTVSPVSTDSIESIVTTISTESFGFHI